MRAGRPTGCGIRLRVYGVRLVADEEGHLVPTGEQYGIAKTPAALLAASTSRRVPDCGCAEPEQDHGHHHDHDHGTDAAAADRRG